MLSLVSINPVQATHTYAQIPDHPLVGVNPSHRLNEHTDTHTRTHSASLVISGILGGVSACSMGNRSCDHNRPEAQEEAMIKKCPLQVTKNAPWLNSSPGSVDRKCQDAKSLLVFRTNLGHLFYFVVSHTHTPYHDG